MVVLVFLLRRRITKNQVIALVAMSTIAVLYTTLWDNYLVANRVWWYDPELVAGITLGWVPLEEYLFFILETLLVGLWFLFLWDRTSPGSGSGPNSARWIFPVLLGVLWILMASILVLGWAPGRYLALILVWALPPIMLQLAYGADLIWKQWKLILSAILSAALYLSVADWIAIRAGIWTISPKFTVGIVFGGTLPLEEAVFFLLTATLVVFGIYLIRAPESQARLARAWSQLKRRTDEAKLIQETR